MEKEFVPFFKSFKFIPTEKNNPIGIIINPHSADVYENVISFINNNGDYSESLRNTFVGRELFNNTSWQDLFNLIESNAQLVSDVKATFKVSYDDFKKLYPNQPASMLLNKDYGILQININNQTKEYLFYQIENTYADPTNEGTYIFEASLDIYMTYGGQIKTKPGSQVFVKRAHIDRLDERGFYDFSINNIIETNLQGIEPDFRDSIKKFGVDWESVNIVSDGDKTRKELEEYLNSLKWEYFYRSTNDLILGAKFVYFTYSQRIGFRVYFSCFSTLDYLKDWKVYFTIGSTNICYIVPNIDDNNYWRIIDNDEMVRNHITSFCPFKIEYISSIFISEVQKTISFSINTPNILIDSGDDYDKLPYVDTILTTGNKMENIQLPVPHIADISENADVTMETTLFNSQFFKIEYGIANHSYAELALDYLVKDIETPHETTTIYNGYSFQPDVNEEWIVVQDQSQDYTSVSQNFYKSEHGSQRILSTAAYDQYLATSQASSMTSAAFKAGMVGIGAGIGIYKGFGKDRGLGRGGGLATGALIAGGLSGVAGEIATRTDMKNKPSELKGNDNIAFYDEWDKKGYTTYYTYKQLNKGNLMQVWSFLKQFGKELNMLMDFNEIIKSRFYYNFVQCEGLFNLLDNQLSTKIKQQMDTDFKKGIRFWHYRNSNTFKGVGNYQYENLEMKILKNSYIKIVSAEEIVVENVLALEVILDIYNNPTFNTTPLVVEYSFDKLNWVALTQQEIADEKFVIVYFPGGHLSVYVRTNNPVYQNNPIRKDILRY